MRAAATLFMFAFLVDYFLVRRRPFVPDVSFEVEDLATPTLFRRTVRLHSRPCSLVTKGVAPAPA